MSRSARHAKRRLIRASAFRDRAELHLSQKPSHSVRWDTSGWKCNVCEAGGK